MLYVDIQCILVRKWIEKDTIIRGKCWYCNTVTFCEADIICSVGTLQCFVLYSTSRAIGIPTKEAAMVTAKQLRSYVLCKRQDSCE